MKQLVEKIESRVESEIDYSNKWDNYDDAYAWVKAQEKKHGRGFRSTQDFKDNIYPHLDRLYRAAKGEFLSKQKKKADDLGFEEGKKVETYYGGMMGSQRITGVTVMYRGKPMVKLDSKIYVSSKGNVRLGKYVNYSSEWKEIK